MKANKKRIIVSVTNDLVSDNRVHKVCSSLEEMGFAILLLGRKLPNSQVLNRSYQTKRFNLLFKKGACFYAEYNLRLFLYLLFAKVDILLSNDLDSLTANFLAAKIRGKHLVYDSHEYFTEVPELIERPKVQKIWEGLEKKIVPKLKHAYTVCDSIAQVYKNKYGVDFKVVRNIPRAKTIKTNAPENEVKIILYQGAVNIGRGLEQAILSMQFIDGAKLVIAGDGDIKPQLEALVEQKNFAHKVEFTGRLPIDKLVELTPKADLGLSIEEDLGLNYRYALPNKLFDYIQADVPVLVSNLPEMKAIVQHYKIGAITTTLAPEILAVNILDALNNSSRRKEWHKNLKLAATELTWEKEEIVLQNIYSKFLS